MRRQQLNKALRAIRRLDWDSFIALCEHYGIDWTPKAVCAPWAGDHIYSDAQYCADDFAAQLGADSACGDSEAYIMDAGFQIIGAK